MIKKQIKPHRERHAQQRDVARRWSHKKMAGIGLLEVMLFLFVISATLLIGYAYLAAKKQSEVDQARTAQLQYVNRYIESFAAVNFRLPCPATVAFGAEDCTNMTNVKGYLPFASIGLDASDARAGGSNLLYMVSRSATADLGTATNAFEPANLKDTVAAPSTFAFNQISTGDYCRKLAMASAEAAGIKVFNGATGRRVAYAIAHPGQANADGTGSYFDGRNDSLSNQSMEAPEIAQSSSNYDDYVLARAANELMFNTDCAGHMASLNIMGLSVNVIDEVKAQFEATKEAADLEVLVSIFKTLIAAYDLGMAGLSLGTSIIELGVYSAALAAAVVTCIVLVGCAFIPPYTAAVATQTVALVLNGVAVGLATAAIVINIVYIVEVAKVAALAGSAGAPGSPDLSAEIAAALTRKNDATAEKTNAAARLVTAQNNAAAAAPALITARQNLLNTTRATITAANAAAVPITTVANTINDSYIANLEAKLTLLAQARADYDAAAQAVVSAQKGADAPPTAAQAADIAAKQALAATADTARQTAQTQYDIARSDLIAVNNRPYCQLLPNPFAPPPTINDCSFSIDNRVDATAKIDDFQAKFLAAKTANDGVITAQNSYNGAVSAETSAIDAYDQLVAVNATVSPGTGAPLAPWAGAEPILQAADAKGGAK